MFILYCRFPSPREHRRCQKALFSSKMVKGVAHARWRGMLQVGLQVGLQV